MIRAASMALLYLGLCSCEKAPIPQPEEVEAPAIVPTFVGRYIRLDGVVSNTPVPQIWGVDLWGLEHFAGHRLRVTGTLQCTVVVRTGYDTYRSLDSGRDRFVAPVLRGPGTNYRLQGIKYELVRSAQQSSRPNRR